MTKAIDRRGVLRGGLGLLGATLVPASGRAWATPQTAALGGRTLVLLQLSGGNDGLSTVVPHGDDAYHASRKSALIESDEVLRLDDYRGLHPALERLRALYDDGRFAIIEGCGYPGPNRSHFKSLDIWHAADPRGRVVRKGWIGRLCEAAWDDSDDPNLVVHVGRNVPFSLHSPEHPPASFAVPQGYRWAGDDAQTAAYEQGGRTEGEEGAPGARHARMEFLRGVLSDAQESSARIRRATTTYRPRVEYPESDPFGLSLRHIAALLEADLGSRVFSVELDGFDTHGDQRSRHDRLMQRLDRALGAFLADVAHCEAGRETIVLVFSEFGRRLRENGSRGTDHGVAGPMFAAGHAVRGGLYGRHPSLTQLDSGDLVHTTDFRSVYATVVERWFGVPSAVVLGGELTPLDFV